MSFAAMAWAYAQSPESAPEATAGTLHHVLLGLANYAHDGEDEGVFVTWVAVKRLAEELHLGERTVRRAIEALEEQGLLERARRRRQDGTWSTYRYALPVARMAAGAPTGQDGRWVEPPAEHESDQPPAEVAAQEPQAPTTLEPQTLAARPRDELFEAVAEACDIDWHDLTKSARGQLNRAVRELRAVDATPAEVHRRAAEYLRRWAVDLTPTALAKHWPRLGTPAPVTIPRSAMHPADVGTMLALERLASRREEDESGRPDGGGAGQPPVRGLPGE